MRFAELSVRHRVAVLGIVPLTAAALLTTPLVTERVRSAQQSERAALQMERAHQVGQLITDLQRERLLANVYLATKDGEGSPISEQAVRTDSDADDLDANLGTGAPEALTAALAQTADLAAARRMVLARELDPGVVNALYGGLIATVIDALGLADVGGPEADEAVGREQTMVESLLRTHEHSSALGAALLAAISSDDKTRQLVSEVEGLTAAQKAERNRFLRLAWPSEATQFQAVEAGSAAARVQAFADSLKLWAYRGAADDSALGELADHTSVSRISAAADSQDQLRFLVRDKIVQDAALRTHDKASEADELAVGFALAALALAAVMAWLTARIGRSIVRPLRSLQGAAEEIAMAAETELARVAEETTQAPPQAHLPLRLQRVKVLNDDELGALASHFNRVQDAAVELIERQMRSSRNASAMLVNVGHRTQNLAALQLSMIDELERCETDPALLQSLYRLDHVTTRLRRYADSLIVLSGRPEPSLVSSPVRLDDLTRSAVAKVMDFTRVRLQGELPSSPVAPHLASDLALAIAELLDNATAFSSPQTSVDLSAEELPDGGCLMCIVDHGVGLSEARLAAENARLASEERLDRATTEFLGLFVVGRISRRHGFDVHLDHTSAGGLTVRLKVPASAFFTPVPPPEVRSLDSVSPPVVHEPTLETLPILSSRSAAPLPSLFTWFGRPSAHAAQRPTSSGTPKTGRNAAAAYTAGVGLGRRLTLSAAPLHTTAVSATSPPESAPLPAPYATDGAAPQRAGRTRARSTPRDGSDAAERPSVGQRRGGARPPSDDQGRGNARPPGNRNGAAGDIQLVRRVPGAQLPAGAFVPHGAHVGPRPTADPDAARSMIEQFEQGIARALEADPGTPTS